MISSDRQSSLINAMVEEILRRKLVSVSSRDVLFQKVREGFSRFLAEWEEIHREAEQKIRSIKRGVLQGSAEWDVLYLQFFEEKYKRTSSLLLKQRSSST